MMMALLIVAVSPLSLSGEGPVYMPDVVLERVLIACLAASGVVGVVLATRRDTVIGLGGVVAVVLGAILTVEAHTSPLRRARYYDVPTLGAVATAHTPPDGTVFGYPDLSLEYDVYVHRRIVEIGSEQLTRLLAEPSKDVVIMTRVRARESNRRRPRHCRDRLLSGPHAAGGFIPSRGASRDPTPRPISATQRASS